MWYVTLPLTSHTLIPREESPEEEQVNTLRRIFKELPRENYFICRQMFHLMLVMLALMLMLMLMLMLRLKLKLKLI